MSTNPALPVCMATCRRTRLLRRLRVSALSSTAALFLVGLMLCPFSAPFKTFDLTADCRGTSNPADQLDSDDVLVVTADVIRLPLASSRVGNLPISYAAHRALRAATLVLRL